MSMPLPCLLKLLPFCFLFLFHFLVGSLDSLVRFCGKGQEEERDGSEGWGGG